MQNAFSTVIRCDWWMYPQKSLPNAQETHSFNNLCSNFKLFVKCHCKKNVSLNMNNFICHELPSDECHIPRSGTIASQEFDHRPTRWPWSIFFSIFRSARTSCTTSGGPVPLSYTGTCHESLENSSNQPDCPRGPPRRPPWPPGPPHWAPWTPKQASWPHWTL